MLPGIQQAGLEGPLETVYSNPHLLFLDGETEAQRWDGQYLSEATKQGNKCPHENPDSRWSLEALPFPFLYAYTRLIPVAEV